MRKRHVLIGATLLAGTALAATLATSPPKSTTPSLSVVPGSSDTAQTPLAAPMATNANLTANVASAVERMPRDADSSNQAAWWIPLAVYGGASYFAFDAPDTANPTQHYVKIGKRDTAGNWTFGILKNADGTTWGPIADDPGHDAPTIAIDGDGYIHVWADMHNNDWRYFRSAAPGDISDLRRSTDMPGSGGFTYPVAKTAPNGDVWLFIRNNASVGELYHWTNTSNVWVKTAVFASSANAVVYPDDMVFESSGAIDIAWEWAYQMPRALRHYGSFLRYRPGTNSWSYIDGTAATIPVSLTSDPKLFFLPLQPGESFTAPDTAQGLQSVKIALDPSSDRPTIAYRYRPTDNSGDYNFDVWRVRWNGSGWIDREKIYAASNDVPAGLGLTRSATLVRLYFATFGGGMQRATKTGTTSWTITALAPGKAIQRVNVAPLNATTDIIYGGAPTDIDANTGSVYWQSVAD